MTYHLSLDGVDDYLQLPTMSFHKVEIDGIIYAPTDGNNDYIIDAQPGVTNGYVILKPDGTVIRAGAAITVTPNPPVCGSRGILTLEGNSATYFTEPNLQGTDDITLFADHMSTSNLKADVYSVKVYDGLGNLIAHYDFTTQEYEAGALIPDLTGNGYNATLIGGTWVDGTSSDVAQHIYFDGVDDYASTTVHGGGSGYSEGEIDLLIYSDNDYSSNSLYIHAGSSNFHIYIDINGNIKWNSSTISSITINNVTLTNGQPFTWWDERIKIHFIGVSGNLYSGGIFAYTGGDRYYLKANLYGLQYYRTNSVVTKFDIANGSILDVAPNDPADTMTLTGGTWVKGGGISNYYLSMDGVDDSLITTLPTGVTADYVELDVLFTDPQINAYAYILGDTSIRINNESLQFSTGVTGFKMGERTLLTIDLVANSSPQNILSVFYRGQSGAGYGSYACEGNIYDVKYYTGGKGGTLLAHYDISTGTVKDQSGNGNDAILNGGLWILPTSGTTYTSSLTDSITTNDNLTTLFTPSSNIITKFLNDSIIFNESYNNKTYKKLLDSINNLDIINKNKYKTLNDTITTNDTIYKKITTVIVDYIPTSDNISKQLNRSLLDSISTNESTNKNDLKLLEDFISNNDNILTEQYKLLLDTLISDDSITTFQGKAKLLIDTIKISDFINKSLLLNKNDSILTDENKYNLNRLNINDEIISNDFINIYNGKSINIYDSILINDSINKVLSSFIKDNILSGDDKEKITNKSLIDAIGNFDSINTKTGKSILLLDNITALDNISKYLSKIKFDGLNIGDNTSKSLNVKFYDVILTTDFINLKIPEAPIYIGTVHLDGKRNLYIYISGQRSLAISLEGGLMTKENQDFNMYSGEAKNISINISDENDKVLNIKNCTLNWKLIGKDNIILLKDSSSINELEITDAAGGIITVYLNKEDTINNTGIFRHELEMIDINGKPSILSKGKIMIKKSYI